MCVFCSVPVAAPKEAERLPINDVEALEEKLKEIRYPVPFGMRRVPWIETLAVTAAEPTPDLPADAQDSQSASSKTIVKTQKAANSPANQDREREQYFVKLLSSSMEVALTRVRALSLKFTRPSDFLAEMLKSDQHMEKVRAHISTEAERLKSFEVKRTQQLQKKFNKMSGNPRVKQQQENKRRNEELRDIEQWKKDRQLSKQKGHSKSAVEAEQEFDQWLVSRDTHTPRPGQGKKDKKGRVRTGGQRGDGEGAPKKGTGSRRKGHKPLPHAHAHAKNKTKNNKPNKTRKPKGKGSRRR